MFRIGIEFTEKIQNKLSFQMWHRYYHMFLISSPTFGIFTTCFLLLYICLAKCFNLKFFSIFLSQKKKKSSLYFRNFVLHIVNNRSVRWKLTLLFDGTLHFWLIYHTCLGSIANAIHIRMTTKSLDIHVSGYQSP